MNWKRKSDVPPGFILRPSADRRLSLGPAACWLLAFCFLGPLGRFALAEDADNPFTVTTHTLAPGKVRIDFSVPPKHHLYAEKLRFELDGSTNLSLVLPEPVWIQDRFEGGRKQAFETNFSAELTLPGKTQAGGRFSVQFQGCNEESCFFPQTVGFTLGTNGVLCAAAPETASVGSSIRPEAGNLLEGWKIASRASGYLSRTDFLRFLNTVGNAPSQDESSPRFQGWGKIAVLGSVLLGGLALNLTPCVLPLIPITLAILGAGASRQSRGRGFLMGAAYGGGMTIAFGSLGAGVVLTGKQFGTLNSSATFNFMVAALFALMALAMFDLISVDLSRLQPRSRISHGSTQGYALAFGMGSLSAILGGACVAPVIISVLLLALALHAKGTLVGLLLPFVLGLGMALPWPLAGAGLSFLPKPGAWMNKIKYAMGVFILVFACYYGLTGWSLLPRGGGSQADASREAIAQFAQDLRAAARQPKPVLIDFWAGWCKNCTAMDHTTFKDETVQKELKNFVFLRFQAEHPDAPATKKVLDQFGVLGLPSYVVLSAQSRP